MASQQPAPQENFSFNIGLNPAIRPLTGGSYPATAYHKWLIEKALFYPGTAESSPRLGIAMKVVASQQEGPDGPIEDTVGATYEHALWMGFADRATSFARMKATGKFGNNKKKTEDEAINEALDQEEARFKGFLCALGHPKADVANLAALNLSPALYVNKEIIGFFERSWLDESEDKWYGPYFTPTPTGDDGGAKALAQLGGKAFHTLYNAERIKEAAGAAKVGGGTVSGGGTTLGAVGLGQGLGQPQGMGGARPPVATQPQGGLGQPQGGGLGQPQGGGLGRPQGGGLGQPNGLGGGTAGSVLANA